MKDPIVIDPPGFDCAEAWKECGEYVKKCGGLTLPDGQPNWRALIGGEPAVMSCPACRCYLHQWGKRVRCPDCAFEFPTDWWPMYSWGSQHGHHERSETKPPAWSNPRFMEYLAREHRERMSHPYYRYGYEHPTDKPSPGDPIDWRAATAGQEGDNAKAD